MSRARAALAAGSLVLLFAGLARLPLLDPDEGRYARSAQEMIHRGDFVVPYFDGRPRLKKPILFYWLQIASFETLGFSELAARLPSVLAGAATLLGLFVFARSRLGEGPAAAAAAVLATTPLFLGMARTGTIDMTLTFLVFGATASLYAGVVEPAPPRFHLITAGFCLGLGLLAKGPVALLVPILAVPAAAFARKREPITISGKLVTAVWIMIAVALPWVVVVLYRVGWEHVLEIWRREALDRYVGGLDHPERPWYFLLTAPITFFPWSAFLPFAVWSGLRRLRSGEGLTPLLLMWCVGGFVFFSIGRGKLDSYLLPLTPAAALLVAQSMSREDRARRAARWACFLLGGMGLVLLAPLPHGKHASGLEAVQPALALACAAAAGLIALMAYARKESRLPFALAAAWGCALLALVLFVPVSAASERSTRELASEAGLDRAPGPLYVLKVQPPSLGFYADRTPTYVPSSSLLLRLVGDREPESVVLETRRSETIRKLLGRGFRVAGRAGRLTALRRRGDPPGGPT